MTRNELHAIKAEYKRLGCKWKSGYCCYQDDNIDLFDMIAIGRNDGVYGWNWTLFYCPKNNTFYLSGYRNM